MTEIGFYHLTRSSLEDVLPKLLMQTLSLQERGLILCKTADEVKKLDIFLWEFSSESWLAHAPAAEDHFSDRQPVLLACEPEWEKRQDKHPPNQAKFLFLVKDAVFPLPLQQSSFSRVFDIFSGTDPHSLQAARERYRLAKQEGHSLSYWQQTEKGWAKKTG